MTNDVSKLTLDLPLLLPEVPDERDRCVQTLKWALRKHLVKEVAGQWFRISSDLL